MALLPGTMAQAQAGGIALVIGNSRYQQESSLPNARRDTTDVAERFRAYGLQTELIQDADRATMQAAIARFGEKAKSAGFAAFYYAGHGVFWNRATWLVPVDGDLGDPKNVKDFIIVDTVRKAINSAARRMMVFDNCLNNPADGWRQRATEDRARSSVELGAGGFESPNTLIMFSTIVGRIALDGPPGENSPFAAAFLKQFNGAPVDLSTMPQMVRRDLLIATEGRQIAYERNAIQGPFQLSARGPVRAAAPQPASSSQIIELTNAYAFAQRSALPLPQALVAFRPAGQSTHRGKPGAYQFEIQGTPAILVVLSVDDQGTAQVVLVMRVNDAPLWMFVKGKLANGEMEVEARDGGKDFNFTWKDANSGPVLIYPSAQHGRKTKPFTSRFTRLDG